MIEALTGFRVVFVLGIVNLVSGILVLFTCRCIPPSRFTPPLMQYRWYQRLFRYHCYIWLVFWVSVVVHAVFALVFVGWPF